MKKAKTAQGQAGGKGSPKWQLRLFVAGDEPNSAIARASLDRIREEHLEQRCEIEIIDVLEDFQPALEENVLVTPALVIRKNDTRTVVFGNLTNTEKVLTALQIGSA